MDNQCLKNFKQRIPLIMDAASFVYRTNRNMQIENMFLPYELTSVILAIFCFIYNKSLSLEKPCSMSDIHSFIYNEILPVCERNFSEEEAWEIANYCVISVLQNGGKPAVYNARDFESEGKVLEGRVALIEDVLQQNENGIIEAGYKPTLEGYDFYFRTYELAYSSEYDVQTMILQQQLKMGQYGKLVDTANKYLNEIRIFFERINFYEKAARHDILGIDIEELSQSIDKFYDLAKEREKNARETLKQIDESKRNIYESNLSQKELWIAMDQLKQTEKLIIKASDKIRQCLLREKEIQDLIQHELIRYNANITKHFDMQDVIIDPILSMKGVENIDPLFNIMAPLLAPVIKKHLLPSAFYAMQELQKEEQEEEEQKEEAVPIDETEQEKYEEQGRTAGVIVFYTLLSMAQNKDIFRISEIWNEITLKENYKDYISIMVEKDIFYQVFSHLFQCGEEGLNLDKAMRELKTVTIRSNGFTYSVYYVLNEINANRPSLINEIETITALVPDDNRFILQAEDSTLKETHMKDLEIHIRKKEDEKNDEL